MDIYFALLWLQPPSSKGFRGNPRALVAARDDGWKSRLISIKAFSDTDFTEDLKKIDVPALILHGDDDQIVPVADSLSAKLLRNSTRKIYAGIQRGMCTTNPADGSRALYEISLSPGCRYIPMRHWCAVISGGPRNEA